MRILILMLSLLVALPAWATPAINPAYKEVELSEFTSLSLDILPDAGTQLIFPFVLDNPELTPPLKVQLTNSDGFAVPTNPKDMKVQLTGQNTLSIVGVPAVNELNPVYIGNLFVSVGGYNLTVALRTTYDPSKHVTNIIFKIADNKRDHLIEKAAERKIAILQKNYEEKMKRLDVDAASASLAHVAAVALEEPTTTAFKTEENLDINDKRIIVYIDRLMDYNGKYQILLFDLENHNSSDFSVENLTLSTVTDKAGERNITGYFKCDRRLRGDEVNNCSFVTTDRHVLEGDKLKLSVNTDRGTGAVSW